MPNLAWLSPSYRRLKMPALILSTGLLVGCSTADNMLSSVTDFIGFGDEQTQSPSAMQSGHDLANPPIDMVDNRQTIQTVSQQFGQQHGMSAVNPPSLNVGDQFSFDNPNITWQVVSSQNNMIYWQADNGDTQITSNNPILPALEWRSSIRGNGQRVISGLSNPMFPLQVGKTVRFQSSVTTDQPPYNWEFSWICQITNFHTISSPVLGNVDTYQIICGRGQQDELLFEYSPEIGHYIRMEARGNDGFGRTVRQLVAYSRAGSGMMNANNQPSMNQNQNMMQQSPPQMQGATNIYGEPIGAPVGAQMGAQMGSTMPNQQPINQNMNQMNQNAFNNQFGNQFNNSSGNMNMAGMAPTQADLLNSMDNGNMPQRGLMPSELPANSFAGGNIIGMPSAGGVSASIEDDFDPLNPSFNPNSDQFQTGDTIVPFNPNAPRESLFGDIPPIGGNGGNGGNENQPSSIVSATPPSSQSSSSGIPVMQGTGNGINIHLASYRQSDIARKGWTILSEQYADILAGLEPVITMVDIPGKGTYHRLLAGAFNSETNARDRCRQLQARGAYCAVMR